MESTTLDPRTSSNDLMPVVNHYAPRHEITESIVTGKPVTALCGHRYVVTAQGGGSTERRGPGSVICPMCARIHDGIRQGEGK